MDSITKKVKDKNSGKLAEWCVLGCDLATFMFMFLFCNDTRVPSRNGDGYDARGRCYGFPPGSSERLRQRGIRFHMSEFEGTPLAEIDEARNWRCSVELPHAGAGDRSRADIEQTTLEDAIDEVAKAVTALVPEEYRRFLDLAELIALQPNCHNGMVSLGRRRMQKLFILLIIVNSCSGLSPTSP